MNGKVVVITGAPRRASARSSPRRLWHAAPGSAAVDHAPSQIPPAPDRIEFGGVDLSDAAQAKKAIDAAAAHFGRLDALINIAGAFCVRDGRRWRSKNLAAHVRDQPAHRAECVAIGTPASRGFLPPLPGSSIVGAMGCAAAGAGMGPYARVQSRRTSPHRGASAAEWKGKITVNAVLAVDHRPTAANRASMPKADFQQMGDAARTGRGDPVSRKRCRQCRFNRRAAPVERAGLSLTPPPASSSRRR